MDHLRALSRVFLAPGILALGLLSSPLQAQSPGEVLTAELLPGWTTVEGTRMAALRLDLAPEWKTYWRSPGDAGIPPLFDWSGSQNLAGVKFHWPRPHVFELGGMHTIGYKHELVLPMELTPVNPAQPILLRASVDLGVCRDICIPAQVQLEATMSGAGASDPAIKAALADRPETGREAGLVGIACSVEPIRDGLRITARLALPPTGGEETVVFEPGSLPVWVSPAEVRREGDTLLAMADMVPGTGTPFALDRQAMTVTVLGRDRAVEIRGCPAAP